MMAMVNTVAAVVDALDQQDAGDNQQELLEVIEAAMDHRTEPRSTRKSYDHGRALACVLQDYLGPEPLYGDGKFQATFRVTKQRFQRIHDGIMGSGNPFFFPPRHNAQVSTFARILYPLKTLAHGTSRTAFEDYYQFSNTFAGECSKEFDLAIGALYTAEYLRRPTADDLKRIELLHFKQHGVRGMYGSLDCMHSMWKNCPKAWQQSFVGKVGKATIVLEAISDYNLWFWHVFFGSGGSFNDLNVLDSSNLLKMILDGVLEELERDSGAVPYEISGQVFHQLFILVDGIYPRYSRFVRGFKDPLTPEDRVYSSWQEGARKDIERAFGVLQARFQWVSRPTHLMDMEGITRRMKTCLILHNMGVSDRIMENDVHSKYDPAFGLDMDDDNMVIGDVVQEADNQHVVAGPNIGDAALANARWISLTNFPEHFRLLNALKEHWN